MAAPVPKSGGDQARRALASVPPHPNAPASSTGPGPATSALPLGVERNVFELELEPASPASPLDWPTRHVDKSESNFQLEKIGGPISLENEEEEQEYAARKGPSRAAQLGHYIRDRLTAENIYKVQAVIDDPSLAMTLAQQELVAKIGRYASVGDKSSVRRGLLELVEKVDVSSPADSALLLVRPDPGAPVPAGLFQQLTGLEGGKQPVEATQGGRILGRLEPILAENGAFGRKDGMDRVWGRLTQRFAQQATGQVDILVPHGSGLTPPAAPQSAGNLPLGGWSIPQQGAPGGPPQPGQWVVAGQDGSGQPAIGQWTQPGNVAAANDPAADLGKWKVPGTPSDPVNPPIGEWVQPNAAGNAQLASGGDQAVGQWKVPGTPSDANSQPIGTWVQPDAVGNAQLQTGGDRSLGEWKVPGTRSDPGSAPIGEWVQPEAAGNAQLQSGGDRPLGKWNLPGEQGSTGPQIGQWTNPNAGGSAAHGGAPAPAGGIGSWIQPGAPGSSLPPQVNQWLHAKDLPLADGVNLSDVLRQNPNISGVRLVELIPGQGPQQPSRLGTIASAARSILAKRFGLN